MYASPKSLLYGMKQRHICFGIVFVELKNKILCTRAGTHPLLLDMLLS